MKAVIWTDVFQAGVMVTGLIVVIIVGAVELNGLSEVFSRAAEGQRDKIFEYARLFIACNYCIQQ